MKFWMVWNEVNRPPTYKHTTLASARTEAERLARCNPGQHYHVLELVGTCRKVDIEWESVDPDDFIPYR